MYVYDNIWMTILVQTEIEYVTKDQSSNDFVVGLE